MALQGFSGRSLQGFTRSLQGFLYSPPPQPFFYIGASNVIYKYQLDGTLVTSFGSTGSGNNNFNLILKISIFDGNLYIADGINRRIKIHDLDGVYVGQIPLFNEDGDESLLAAGVDARSGDLYISTDDGTFLLEIDSIQKRSLDGTLAWETINFPNGKGRITFDNGKVFTYNRQLSNTVYTFTASGSPSSDFEIDADPIVKAQDIFAYGNELFATGSDQFNNFLNDTRVFTQSGTFDRDLGIPGTRIAVFDGWAYIVQEPQIIDGDLFGVVVVADITDGTILNTIYLSEVTGGEIAVG